MAGVYEGYCLQVGVHQGSLAPMPFGSRHFADSPKMIWVTILPTTKRSGQPTVRTRTALP
ncbi:AKR_collapsed_G0016940.mRNA.1.CDS.1 [Saccharomyces cerevisiae]|nr:AKR_collapsed_G0016940.mRNA.1.CDS.1 [Saccharomyces cerevisiae]